MTSRMIDLPNYLKATKIYFIGSGNADDLQSLCPVLIDGMKNSTKHDLALFFNLANAAQRYQNQYPSLRKLDIFQATITEMIAIFGGKVEYFIVWG